ncbi:glycine cleavage system protein GcvH [Nakamurella antarctica]|uniref:Glycine cleavage system H protein n=1 Tax=Nakamurella antarctica TaxID=1902245 RepID=A0A3G8ZRK5_9ACTN|nr:glycine cleavage system protein GcvH [Nakamurella antarctica]
MIPDELRYSAEHEWVRTGEENVVRVGITDFAQGALGDIVFVQLPDLGAAVTAGDSVGEVESTKSVSELFTPLSGTVVTRNESLDSAPELVNSDPYGEGWMFELEIGEVSAVDDLLDSDAYAEITGE